MADVNRDNSHIAGTTAEHFDLVRRVFLQNFTNGEELGASFAVFIDGAPVVDIYGGFSDRKQEAPWAAETLACIYSSGKAALSLLVARAVSDGKLDYAAPVAQYWPEFAESGKGDITIAQSMSHQDGLAAIADTEMPPETWLNWDAVTARIAAMAPLWEPGAASGYHPQTFGFIAGELLRRVEGKSVGELVSEFGLNVYCGLQSEQIARTAAMPKPPRAPDLGDITELKKLAFLSKSSGPGRSEDWMAAQIPASNMHANATGLAEFVYPLANNGETLAGEQLLSAEAIEAAFAERIRGDDLVLPFNLSWAAGLMRNINHHFGPNQNAFGHAGFGGSCVVIDPDNRLTAAYVMNKMSPHLVGDPRAVRLLDAVYNCLD